MVEPAARTGAPSGQVPDVVLLTRAYAPLVAFADRVDDATGWQPTRLPGWSVRDLLFHLASDCQRALVALFTPVTEPADTDRVSYWAAWRPGTQGAADGLRGTRIIASAWSSVRGVAELYAETARAVCVAAASADPEAVVRTQDRRIRVADLLHTLCVEATVHQLDLRPVLADPAPELLDEVRRVLDGLLGRPLPPEWDAVRAVEVGTGRAVLTPEERAAVGADADRFPLFG
jgi:hypothetical protein